MKQTLTFLGGLTADEFLRDYWQKEPLLIRQAFPGFNGLLDRQQLISLACWNDVQARLVSQQRGKWRLQHGPFKKKDFKPSPGKLWTVLVQGVNHCLPGGADLLKHFSFVPHARLDDLMVSYAPKGGGVGPHFDSYDVFLLQGTGQRRWQISTQPDRTLIDGAPLRILKNFEVEQEWIVQAGDMLYLPPQCAHNGIAEDDCMTYSIGFRTPAYQELAEQFLIYLQDRLCLEGMYADPDLKVQSHPSEIGAGMLRQVERQAIRQVQWNKGDIADFLGCYLSEPKPHVYFDPPAKPASRRRFDRTLQARGIELDLKSQMLCHGDTVFINGNAYPVDARDYRILRSLADHRRLAPSVLPEPVISLLYRWYVDGYIAAAENQ